jgi:hypothetical protein
MQKIPRLSDVYKDTQKKADAKHAQLQQEVAQGPYAMQVNTNHLPPTDDAVQRARWHQINGPDAIYPGDVPSAEQQHVEELKKKIAELESKLQ